MDNLENILSKNNNAIRSGGSSSSEKLNAFFDAIRKDIVLIKQNSEDVSERVSLLNQLAALQVSGFGAALASIETRLQSISASGETLIDMASSLMIDGSSTMTFLRKYSQAVLPIVSTQNLLTLDDVYGEKYVPDAVKMAYGWSVSGADPSFVYDPKAINMLLGKDPWILDFPSEDPADTELLIKLDYPLTYVGLRPNVLEFLPAPCFLGNITRIAYRNDMGTNLSGWTNFDYTYLPGYNPAFYGDTNVHLAGPTRISLPDVGIKSIIIGLQFDSATDWGLSSLSLKHEKYSQTAELIVNNPYGDISSAYLKGKDPEDLALFSNSLVGPTATYSISSTTTDVSPIITGVVVNAE